MQRIVRGKDVFITAGTNRGVGKTTAAIYFSNALEELGLKTLEMDCDVNYPVFSRYIDRAKTIDAPIPELLTRREVADMLKVCPKTVSRLSDAKILKRHSIGERAYRYIKSEIFEYLGLNND